MKAKLQIRNFGPIKDINIEISKFNILIGPQGAGKSTVSKVLCVVQAYFAELSYENAVAKLAEVSPDVNSTKNANYNRLIKLLINYRIEFFKKPNSYWYFEDDFFSFELNGKNIQINRKKEENVSRSQAYYIPAERIALPMISESLFELTLEQSTLPNYFLQFGKDFTIARKNQALFNIPILKVEFEHKDGRNMVILPDSNFLLLEETSSAIQANLPLLVILQYPLKIASLFVIEELELHGFPTLQRELLYYIVERMRHPQLNNAYVMLPTHSPYLLSAANNLLFAAKVAKQDDETAVEVNKIISKGSWIEKEEFSAYYIKDGKATSIVDNKTGLIYENELDSVSEDLAGEFDALMDLYKPAIA
ncbi:MAG TPA: AAA family ATPase [Mucilaginibacter sp.]|jgi:predicted ATPase|nr:AAA family ATPase [Mucilaginibacter sp.]